MLNLIFTSIFQAKPGVFLQMRFTVLISVLRLEVFLLIKGLSFSFDGKKTLRLKVNPRIKGCGPSCTSSLILSCLHLSRYDHVVIKKILLMEHTGLLITCVSFQEGHLPSIFYLHMDNCRVKTRTYT